MIFLICMLQSISYIRWSWWQICVALGIKTFPNSLFQNYPNVKAFTNSFYCVTARRCPKYFLEKMSRKKVCRFLKLFQQIFHCVCFHQSTSFHIGSASEELANKICTQNFRCIQIPFLSAASAMYSSEGNSKNIT